MSWELDLQYAKGRLSAELQAAAGGRRLDLVLIQSEGHDEFERLLNDALPDFRPNTPRPSDAILSRSRLVTLPPALSDDCRVWGRTILCKALLPRSVTEWDDAAELDRRNRLAESLQECFAELGSCLALAPPPLQSLIESAGVATLDPLGRWLFWLFDRALRPNAKPPLSAARDYGTVSAADAATSLRQAPESGWFAVLPDALRASQFLVDVITTKTPPAADDESATREARDGDASPPDAGITWPPDDGWHFRLDEVWFRSVRYMGLRADLIKILELLVKAKGPVSYSEINAAVAPQDTMREDATVQAQVTNLRKWLKNVFVLAGDPITPTAKGTSGYRFVHELFSDDSQFLPTSNRP